jgi:hypothetical protein
MDSTNRSKSWGRWLGWAAALIVLALVFAWYAQPAMMLELATQLWNCF